MTYTITLVIKSDADPSLILDTSIEAAERVAEEVGGTSYEDLVSVTEASSKTYAATREPPPPLWTHFPNSNPPREGTK